MDGLDITDEKRDEYRRLLFTLGAYKAFPHRIIWKQPDPLPPTDEPPPATEHTIRSSQRSRDFCNKILGHLPPNYQPPVFFDWKQMPEAMGDWKLCAHQWSTAPELSRNGHRVRTCSRCMVVQLGTRQCDEHGHAWDHRARCERCGFHRGTDHGFRRPQRGERAKPPIELDAEYYAEAFRRMEEGVKARCERATQGEPVIPPQAKRSKAKPWSACPNVERMLEELVKDNPRCTSCSGSIMQRKAVGPAHVLRNVWECPVCHTEVEDVEAVEVKPLQLPPHGDGLH